MKQTLLLGGIGVVLAGLLGYNWLYTPQQARVREIQTQIAEEQEHQRTTASVATQLQHIERYREQLSEAPDPSWLAREMVALAEQSGIQIASIIQRPPQQADPLTFLTVDLRFTTSYHQLGAFLDRIERAERFVRINELQLDRDGEAGEASIQLVVSTLFLPPLLEGS